MKQPKIKKLTELQLAKQENKDLLITLDALRRTADKAKSNEQDALHAYNGLAERVKRLSEKINELRVENGNIYSERDELKNKIVEFENKQFTPTVKFENNKITITYEN